MTNTTYIANGYQQDNGDNGKWWKLLLFVACIILICIIFHGCNPEKKIAKAKQTVLTDSAAFDFIGRKFVDLNPCLNTVTHTSDTVTLTAHDTTETFYHYTDSINRVDTIKQTIKLTVTKTVVDTVVDEQKIKLLQSQLSQRDLTIAGTNGQLLAAHEAVQSAEKKTRTVEIILGAIVLIFVGTIAFKIYSMVTSKTISTAGTTTTGIVSSITNMFKK